MKRFLLFTLVICLFAVQANAGLFEINIDVAEEFRPQSFSDPLGIDTVNYIGYAPGGAGDLIYGSGDYQSFIMQNAVGFYGNLTIDDPTVDNFASVFIGVDPSTITGLTGYDGMSLNLANDDQQIWEVALYALDGGTYTSPDYSTAFVPLNALDTTQLTLNFGGNDISTLDEIGFIVRFNIATTGGNISTADDFHTSVSVEPVEPTCSLEVSMEACVSAPPSSEDDCKGRIISMELEYTGDGCEASSHSQKSDKVGCSGDPDGAEVTIVVTNKKGDRQWGAALDLPIGGTVVVDAANAGKDKLDADTLVKIFDASSGDLLQEVKFHTSCSQPLSVGNQFGSVKVISMTTTEGGTVTLAPDGSCITELPGTPGSFDVKYTYTVANTSATAVTNVTVVDDVFGTVPGSPIASIGAYETVEWTVTASLSEATTNTVVVTADEGCSAGASADITKAPPPMKSEKSKHFFQSTQNFL